MSKLTAKRIAYLKGKIKHFRVYKLNGWKDFFESSKYEVAYGLNMSDAIKRLVRKYNREDSPFTPWTYLKFVSLNYANYAIVPEGAKSRKEVKWIIRYSV